MNKAMSSETIVNPIIRVTSYKTVSFVGLLIDSK